MAVGFVELLSSASKVISTTWRHGSRFLLSIACSSGAAAAVLWLGAHFAMPKAKGLWEEYGLMLIIAAVVSAILAAFKYFAERQNRLIVLVADEEQSLWHHAAQPDGKVFTQFLLRFHVTNMADGGLHLSKVRLNWPWIGRKRIVSSMIVTQHPDPQENVVSSYFPVRPHGRQQCSANIMVTGTVGGARRRRPMRVSVSVQDHAARWHKVVLRDLRDPQFQQTSNHPRRWLRIVAIAVIVAIVLALTGWGWKHYL